MADAKGRILLISADPALSGELAQAAAAHNLDLVVAAGRDEAAAQLAKGAFAALVVDLERVAAAERDQFAALRAGAPQLPLFFLETRQSLAPDTPAPLRRLPWPLHAGFADQVRATDRIVVLFSDQTLFTTAALQVSLQQAGVQIVPLESANGLVKFLQQQQEAIAPKPKKNLWQRLGGESEAQAPALLGRVAVVLFSGSVPEVEELDSHIRRALPDAVCYLVSSLAPARAAALAIKTGQPMSLMREAAGRIPGFLDAGGKEEKAAARHGGRILLVDNFKPTLSALSQALMREGYEVVPVGDGDEALRLFQKEELGSFHLAVIGTAIAYAQHSGAEFAQKLRERDPDLRIIFMVDRYPVKEALQGVSQVVELGLDDALLKPVESSRLIFSVQRALERRFLLLENARLLNELQESNRQLAQINEFQKKFFAMVAHDVKNPLTAIMGYSEVLGMRLKNSPNELKSASHIHSAAKTLNLLISDLVDLAAIESGKLRVNIGPLDLAAVVNDVRSRIEIVAAQRKMNFNVELPPGLPVLAGDPARVGQVIQNLCTNAIQYTKEGGSVTVRVQAAADKVVVSVIDTGIGIAKEDLPRIWERFFQTEEAKKMRKAGFGLGLKISREIVQMHGGEMGIESQLGVGSRFFFFLPVRSPAEIAALGAPAQPAPTPAPAQATPPPHTQAALPLTDPPKRL